MNDAPVDRRAPADVDLRRARYRAAMLELALTRLLTALEYQEAGAEARRCVEEAESVIRGDYVEFQYRANLR